MKIHKLAFLLLLLVTSSAFSRYDSSSTARELDTLKRTVDNVSGRLNKIDKSIKHLGDSTNFAANKQQFTDSSSLDSARTNPSVFLYKSYFFNRDNDKVKDNRCTYWLNILYALLALTVLLFTWYTALKYAKNGALLKDESFDADGNLVDAALRPFSFARTQLFWWTMIVFTCYVIFFGFTGVLLPLNTTAICLLGLSAAVYGAAKVIDNTQIDKSKGFRSQDVGPKPAEPEKPVPPAFLADILSDNSGVSIHRFQALIFNVIFGVGFIAVFVENLCSKKYPFADFTDLQFTLMGISSATYLGLKTSENSPANVASNKQAT